MSGGLYSAIAALLAAAAIAVIGIVIATFGRRRRRRKPLADPGRSLGTARDRYHDENGYGAGCFSPDDNGRNPK